jgi:hypothetical protein
MDAFIIVFRWSRVVETEALGFDMPALANCLPPAALMILLLPATCHAHERGFVPGVAVGVVGPRRRCDGRLRRSSSAASPAGEERAARGKDSQREARNASTKVRRDDVESAGGRKHVRTIVAGA